MVIYTVCVNKDSRIDHNFESFVCLISTISFYHIYKPIVYKGTSMASRPTVLWLKAVSDHTPKKRRKVYQIIHNEYKI